MELMHFDAKQSSTAPMRMLRRPPLGDGHARSGRWASRESREPSAAATRNPGCLDVQLEAVYER